VIDAVVVTADSRELVLRCLAHLRSPLLEQTIVVDNASSDGTREALLRADADVKVVRLDEPQGLAFAFNRGAEQGTSGLVLFLNDDVLAEEGSIERLADTLQTRREAVAAAGRLVDPETGQTQLEYQPRRFPGVGRFAGALAGLDRFWPHNPWTGEHRRHPLDEQVTTRVDQPPGACLLVRRRALEAVGGWDEQFHFWFEDVDLARRLRPHGDVLYVPTAPFRHVGGWSSRRLSAADVVDRSYQGALRYAYRHFSRPQQISLGLVYALVAGIRTLPFPGQDHELGRAYRAVFRSAAVLIRGRPPSPR
jgi:GT2 family glycosyltransferase